jgi:hypothetical protein
MFIYVEFDRRLSSDKDDFDEDDRTEVWLTESEDESYEFDDLLRRIESFPADDDDDDDE